jgi:hypothetical protein
MLTSDILFALCLFSTVQRWSRGDGLFVCLCVCVCVTEGLVSTVDELAALSLEDRHSLTFEPFQLSVSGIMKGYVFARKVAREVDYG